MEHDRELIRMTKVWSIAQELDGDNPGAAARRYARMDERAQEEIRGLRFAFVAMDRACGTSRKMAPGRSFSYRLEGGKLVRETEGGRQEAPANGGVGESSSSVAAVAAAAGSDDDLCSAFGSARV
ncbi:hypothetical protein BAE44_0017263 [Dichanthelium oligosanthes]|uniref:Uncharacterized protein n=1 Tax=Dichanthelium oligosanthes TaxID=888268 RepID=A0A1E5V9C6_9POAL|nr:hypothetical protein BAE44_0017263 [Dichanthelium oligosanthes]